MDMNRSPGVGPLAWVTLGLLAFSWLLLSGLMVWDWVRFPPNQAKLMTGTVAWLFVAGPHLLLGLAASRSRGRPKVGVLALIGAVSYACSAGVIGLVNVVDGLVPRLGLLACCTYPLGWPVGIVALRATFWTDPPQVPQGDD